MLTDGSKSLRLGRAKYRGMAVQIASRNTPGRILKKFMRASIVSADRTAIAIPRRRGDEAELVTLVDAHDRPIGSSGKLEAHRTGVPHRAFSILVSDPTGDPLPQRRADAK